jgi:lipoprotein-releasing system permease protein
MPNISPPWLFYVKGHAILPENSIVLPKNYQDYGMYIGDKGYLSYGTFTTSSFQEQRLPVTVAGFYDAGAVAMGSRYILTKSEIIHQINIAGNFFSLDEYMNSGIGIWYKDLSQTTQLKKSLETQLKEMGIAPFWKVSSYEEYDFAKELIKQFQSDKYLFSIVGIIILIVACCNIISLLTLLVNDKKKEIGVLASMGATPFSIALIFALCGIFLGVISSGIGTIAAYFTLSHIDSLAKFLSLLQGHEVFSQTFYGNSLPNTLSSQALIFVGIVTPLIALVAGLIPARKAARMHPTHILRSE